MQAKGARSSAAIPSYSSVKAGAVQQAHECLYIPVCLYIAKLCCARVQHPLTLPAAPQDLQGSALCITTGTASRTAAVQPPACPAETRFPRALLPLPGKAASSSLLLLGRGRLGLLGSLLALGGRGGVAPGRAHRLAGLALCGRLGLRAKRARCSAQTRSGTRRHSSCVCKLGCRRSWVRARCQPRTRHFLGCCARPNLLWCAAQV